MWRSSYQWTKSYDIYTCGSNIKNQMPTFRIQCVNTKFELVMNKMLCFQFKSFYQRKKPKPTANSSKSDKFRVISNFDYYYSCFSFEFSTTVYVICHQNKTFYK